MSSTPAWATEVDDNQPRSVIAMFDSHAQAETARRDLVAAGLPPEDVFVSAGEATSPADAEAGAGHGFWEALKDFFMPDEDRSTFAEGLRRGSSLVHVRAAPSAYPTVLEILDRDGAVNLDEREAGWREQGWSGNGVRGASEGSYAGPDDSTAGFGVSAADLFPIVPDASTPDRAYQGAAPGLTSSPADTGRDDTARPGELQAGHHLQAGSALQPQGALWKRDTSHGRARVRSYVTD